MIRALSTLLLCMALSAPSALAQPFALKIPNSPCSESGDPPVRAIKTCSTYLDNPSLTVDDRAFALDARSTAYYLVANSEQLSLSFGDGSIGADRVFDALRLDNFEEHVSGQPGILALRDEHEIDLRYAAAGREVPLQLRIARAQKCDFSLNCYGRTYAPAVRVWSVNMLGSPWSSLPLYAQIACARSGLRDIDYFGFNDQVVRDQTVGCLDAATRSAPKNSTTKVLRASLLLSDAPSHGANDSAAIALLEEALRLNSSDTEAHILLATIYLSQSRFDLARDHALRAFSTTPNSAEAANELCWIGGTQGTDLKDTLEVCNTAIELGFTQGSTWNEVGIFFDSRALTLLKLGRYEDALDDYRKSNEPLEWFGRDGVSFPHAVALIRAGRRAEGEAALLGLSKSSPKTAAAWAARGVVP